MCELLTRMANATAKCFGSPPPGDLERGQNVIKISFNPNYKVNFKDFFFNPNCVCLLTNERYKTYKMGFSYGFLGHAPGVGTWGCWGSIFYFLNMVM